MKSRKGLLYTEYNFGNSSNSNNNGNIYIILKVIVDKNDYSVKVLNSKISNIEIIFGNYFDEHFKIIKK